ncbi:signal transduction histidine kinase/ligand-binding sensor domain-containing protein/DNA-binding response OmpR family regulator [Filimonas zeae]|uniref:histidine kinase n=1 Tax=Filimonas zeae TaxID=1737353 RepID=A0A917J1X8_9BACT|nr:two-component regulator propeller domain-containing protein [Filimonas zeae]MDR6340809.1 signal transduction histidine kinase/ligand-binding sensor domain-containing protein/DNA-binding response OmpR family regulator [Filimonas zeae]GGH78362.1 hybrid sensor histidine kinase/response regulator [Filimonas zeae]
MILTAIENKTRLCFVMLCMWICLGMHFQAVGQNVQVQYLGIEQGLSNNSITCINQDSKGFMWFGTFDGLNRYDGYSFKVFRNRLGDSATLIDNRITAVCEDSRNNIWVGTKKGLSIYCNIKDYFSTLYYQPNGSTQKVPVHVSVNEIRKTAGGAMLVATAGLGLLKFDGGKLAKQIPCHAKGKVIWNYYAQGIDFDSANQTWVMVHSVGLCRFNSQMARLEVTGSSIHSATCMVAGKNGMMWLGTDRGLAAFNTSNNTLQMYNEQQGLLSDRKIAGLCMDKKGLLWIATDGGGVNILNTLTGSFTYMQPENGKTGINSNAIYAIYEDKEERKWIGTLRGGINLIDRKKNRFSTISHDPFTANSVVNDFILSFCEDEQQNIWIGTDGGGVSCWNRQRNQYTSYKHKAGQPGTLSNNFATSIVNDYHNNIWIATYGGGINRFDAATHTFKKYTCFNEKNQYEDCYVWQLYEDRLHNLWAGTCSSGRLYKYNRTADKFEVFDDRIRDVISLAEDRSGNLWAGNFNTLVRIDTQKNNHRFYTVNFPVRFFHQDKANRCWVGTEGGGLLLLHPEKGDWEVISESEGLSNNSALNMLEDVHGQLWISTFNGLCRFDPDTRHFTNFYGSDGLQTNQFNYNAALRLQSGELLFGGIKGFNLFSPDSVRAAGGMPDLLVTGMRINNQPAGKDNFIKDGKSVYDVEVIRLPYDKAVLSVDFAALEYSAPDKISYAYYMEGWDKDWTYGKLRTANYSRLRDGNYVLHIKCTNAEGVWSRNERVIIIQVLPPWYRSWWAWCLYIGLSVLLVRTWLLYQKRQERLNYEIKLAHLKMEKEKELNERKLSFFTHVSHEFRTPLTLIINPVKELLYSSGKEADPENLNVVYRNAKRLLSLVDQLLLFRKADSEEDSLRIAKLNFYELCYEVYLCFIQQAKNRRIHYTFSCNNHALEVYADREKMEIALFNLLSNALKFTPDGGHVQFLVEETLNQFVVKITDSGCGIAAHAGNKIFDKFYQAKDAGKAVKPGFGIGLFLVKNFIEAHKGTITYQNNEKAGTTFSIALNKGREHFAGRIIFEEVTENAVFLEELMEEVIAEKPLVKEAAKPVLAEPAPLVSEEQTMLIVDDNEEVRQYIARLFKDTFRLYEAGSGEEGLQLAQQYGPDIIISDVMMGAMSGIELCSRIKEEEALSHIPVILLTAGTSTEIKLKGVECGADDYITKPFDKEILMARVESLLRTRTQLQRYFFNEITLQSHSLKVPEDYKAFLDSCIEIVEKHMDDEEFTIKTLATAIGMSHSNLYKKVKAFSGQTVSNFIRFIRLRKAAELFINTSCNVNEVTCMVGINDAKYFREQFYKLFGCNPSEYIRKYRKPFQKTIRLDEHVVKRSKSRISSGKKP